jgi:hypothetical protein
MMPPLQLSFGSSAKSDARGGSLGGDGAGALNEGDWIVQTTGQGDNTAIPPARPQAQPRSSVLLYSALAVGAAWLLLHRH